MPILISDAAKLPILAVFQGVRGLKRHCMTMAFKKYDYDMFYGILILVIHEIIAIVSRTDAASTG